MSSLSALTGNTSSLAALFGSSSSKGTSAATAFAPQPSEEQDSGSTSGTLSSGSAFPSLGGDMQSALLSLQEDMGGTDGAMMPPPSPPPSETAADSGSSTVEAASSASTDTASGTTSATDSTESTADGSSSSDGSTSGASGTGESKEVVSTTYLDNPDGSTTITVTYSDGSTSVTTTGGQGQSVSGSDSSKTNLPYSLGAGNGADSGASLSQTVSNLYASVANSAAVMNSAGVAA